VKNFLLFLIAVVAVITSCQQTANPIVAEAFHHKLYWSDLLKKIPYSSSKADSLLFMERYIDDWVLRKTLLAQAKQALTQSEQEFTSQIEQYKEQLLINAYRQKLSNDSVLFTVSNKEIIDFLNQTKTEETPEYRDMIKLNYIKLSNPSKLYKKIKELFFDDNNRVKVIEQLMVLCADTIEYYLDNEHWFYTDFIENELPFTFSQMAKTESKDRFDFVEGRNRYLILVLDRKQQLQPKNIFEDKKMAQTLLQQQKKAAFLNQYQDSLVQKAIREKKAIRYPIVF